MIHLNAEGDVAAAQQVALSRELGKALSVACFWQFRASVKDLQVAIIRKQPMSLLAGRLTNDAKFHHVLQSLRHSGRRERCSAVAGIVMIGFL